MCVQPTLHGASCTVIENLCLQETLNKSLIRIPGFKSVDFPSLIVAVVEYYPQSTPQIGGT